MVYAYQSETLCTCTCKKTISNRTTFSLSLLLSFQVSTKEASLSSRRRRGLETKQTNRNRLHSNSSKRYKHILELDSRNLLVVRSKVATGEKSEDR